MIRTLVFNKYSDIVCFEIHNELKIIAYSMKNPTDRIEVKVKDDQDGWEEYFSFNGKDCYLGDKHSVILSPNGLVFEVNNQPYPF